MATGETLPLSLVKRDDFRELMAFVELEYEPSSQEQQPESGKDVGQVSNNWKVCV